MITFTNIDPKLVKAWEMAEGDTARALKANEIARLAEALVNDLEGQLFEARRDVKLAEALRAMSREYPSWRNTLGNLRITSHEGQQQACSELGYAYYAFNENVFTKDGVNLGILASALK